MKLSTRQIIKEMFDGENVSLILPYESLDADSHTVELIVKGCGRISISGAQPKFSMVVDNHRLRLTDEGERGRYILKPAPTAMFLMERKYCPANEFITMQLARRIYKIETAPCCLCYFGNGEAAYLVKRFDVASDGRKFHQEDFAQLAGINRNNYGESYKYDALSYEECADIIRRNVQAVPVELLKFFRLVVFNYIVLNDDAHLKNFSLMEGDGGEMKLSPAYDLLNTSLHLHAPEIFALRKGLFKEGMDFSDTQGVDRNSFVEFGHRIGLPEKVIFKVLDDMSSLKPEADELIESSPLSEELKRYYLSSFHYRCSTLS